MSLSGLTGQSRLSGFPACRQAGRFRGLGYLEAQPRPSIQRKWHVVITSCNEYSYGDFQVKLEEKNKAQQLRYQGFSIKQIAETLNVSKGSASGWVRDIVLQENKFVNIENRRRLGRDQSRKTRLSNIAKANIELCARCKEEILPFSQRDLWVAGLMVYAGEGSKTAKVSNQHVEVTNSNPDILRIFIKFLMNICSVPRSKIRVRLILYEDIDSKEACDYWSEELDIPSGQFQNPFIKQSYANLPYRHLRRSKYGTAHVNLYDVKIYRKIMGWLQSIYEYNNLDFRK